MAIPEYITVYNVGSYQALIIYIRNVYAAYFAIRFKIYIHIHFLSDTTNAPNMGRCCFDLCLI